MAFPPSFNFGSKTNKGDEDDEYSFEFGWVGGQASKMPNLTGEWEDTKELMEQIIRKPRMQEKLLRKPPFRYLHDVLMAVYRETNFFAGLYEDDEKNSKLVKQKDAKIKFLSKAITTVNHFYGTELEVHVDKIKTETFLPRLFR